MSVVTEQQIDVAISKSRELAVKVAEREKNIANLKALLTIGEREYADEKEKLETAMLALTVRKEELQKQIKQRSKDYANIASKVSKMEDAEVRHQLNRSLAFVPSFSNEMPEFAAAAVVAKRPEELEQQQRDAAAAAAMNAGESGKSCRRLHNLK